MDKILDNPPYSNGKNLLVKKVFFYSMSLFVALGLGSGSIFFSEYIQPTFDLGNKDLATTLILLPFHLAFISFPFYAIFSANINEPLGSNHKRFLVLVFLISTSLILAAKNFLYPLIQDCFNDLTIEKIWEEQVHYACSHIKRMQEVCGYMLYWFLFPIKFTLALISILEIGIFLSKWAISLTHSYNRNKAETKDES